jgi:hypothetical protein
MRHKPGRHSDRLAELLSSARRREKATANPYGDPYVSLALAAVNFVDAARQAMNAWDIDDAWTQYEDAERELLHLAQIAISS